MWRQNVNANADVPSHHCWIGLILRHAPHALHLLLRRVLEIDLAAYTLSRQTSPKSGHGTQTLPANPVRKVVCAVGCFEALVRKPPVIPVRFPFEKTFFNTLSSAYTCANRLRKRRHAEYSPAKWVQNGCWPFAGLAARMRGRPQSTTHPSNPAAAYHAHSQFTVPTPIN